MNKLNNLTATLNAVEKYAQEILAKAVPIMKDLESPEPELVEDVMESVTDSTNQKVLKVLQNICLGLVEDAEKVVLEIDSFSDSVLQGEEAIDEGEDEYPFLMEVWCGDIYEKEKLAGLKELAADLKDQLSRVDEDKIVDEAIGQLKKKKPSKK